LDIFSGDPATWAGPSNQGRVDLMLSSEFAGSRGNEDTFAIVYSSSRSSSYGGGRGGGSTPSPWRWRDCRAGACSSSWSTICVASSNRG
jgi:hypothetical protein